MSAGDILGMNARNFSYIREYNSRETIRLVDNKLKTKKLLRVANLPVPETYKVFRRSGQVRDFDFSSLPSSFVVKPNSGFGGKGILVVYGKTKNGFLRSDGGLISFEEIRLHILDILEGVYSLSGLPDAAYIEERIKSDNRLKRFSYKGLADIRIIIFNMVPVMAMLRLPTKESRGRANLHEGALGVQVDLNSGITGSGMWRNRQIKFFPGSKNKINGIKVPFWEEILTLSSQAQELIGSSYLGVDVTISKDKGPMILELNARPGLSIQTVNQSGLKDRLEKLKGVKPVLPSSAAALGRELFGKLKSITSPFVSNKPALGLVEQIKVLANKKVVNALAKIDTGADSSAIDFSVAQKSGFGQLVDKMKNLDLSYKDKRELVRKIANLKKEMQDTADILEFKAVRSASGRQIRAKIKIKFKISNKFIESEAYLSDRSGLDFPIILGKDVLEHFLVDPLKYVSSSHKFKVKNIDDGAPFFGLMPKKIVGLSICAADRINILWWLKRWYNIISLKECEEDHLLDSTYKLKVSSLGKKDSQIYKQKSNLDSLFLSPAIGEFDDLLRNSNWLVAKSSPLLENMAIDFRSKILANSSILAKKIKKMFNSKESVAKLGFNFWEENNTLLVSKESLKITACSTSYGSFYSYPYKKIFDKSNYLLGFDFNFQAQTEFLKQLKIMMEQIGDVLLENKYKGVFSLSLIWDQKNKKLFLKNFNTSLPIVLSVGPLLETEEKIPLLLWHVLEFLRAPYEVNFNKIQNQYLKKPVGGGYLEIHNLSDNYIKINHSPRVGIYQLKNNQLFFKEAVIRSPKETEILFMGGVPRDGSIVRPKAKMGRIIFKRKLTKQNCEKIYEFFKKMYDFKEKIIQN